ncbi:histidine kinase osmosensor [Tulasnella sp. 418]|nr:histidine kinase osmosensor [Tulasnella sp. 418]
MHLTPEPRHIPGTFSITDPSPITVVFSDQDDKSTEDEGHSFRDIIRHLTSVISRYETLPFGSLPTPFDELSSLANEHPELGALERAIHSMAMRALSAEHSLMSGTRTDIPAQPQVPGITVNTDTRESIDTKLHRIEQSIADLQRSHNDAQAHQVADRSNYQTDQKSMSDTQQKTLENSSKLVEALDDVAQDVFAQTAKMEKLVNSVSELAVDIKSVGQGTIGTEAQTPDTFSELLTEVRQIALSVKNKPKMRIDIGPALTPLENRMCTLIEAVEKITPPTRQSTEAASSTQPRATQQPQASTLADETEVFENHVAMITAQDRSINAMMSQMSQMAKCAQAIVSGDFESARELVAQELPDSGVPTQFNTLREAIISLVRLVEAVDTGIQQGLQPQNRRSRRESRVFATELHGSWQDLVERTHTTGSTLHYEMESTALALQNLIEGKFDADLPPQRGDTPSSTRRAITTLATMLRKTHSEDTRFFKEIAKGNLLERLDMTNLQGSWATFADTANRMADRLTSQAYEMMGTLSAASSGDINARNTPREIEEESGPIWLLGTSLNEYLTFVAHIHQELSLIATLVTLGGDQPARKIDEDPEHPWHQGNWNTLSESINTMIDAMNAARSSQRRRR